MNQKLNDDVAKLFLRLTVGGLMLPHGLYKLFHGHDFIAQVLNQAGLPEFLKFGVPFGEVIAPTLIILGIFTRLSALAVAGTMLFSIFLAFGGQILTLNQHGGWIVELNVFFLMASLALVFSGAGRFAIQSSHHRLN